MCLRWSFTPVTCDHGPGDPGVLSLRSSDRGETEELIVFHSSLNMQVGNPYTHTHFKVTVRHIFKECITPTAPFWKFTAGWD